MDNPERDGQEPQASDSDSVETPPDRKTVVVADNSGSDAQESNVKDSDSGSTPPDRPAGGDGDHDQDPLIEFLRLLIKDRNITKTAKLLGVDRKTIWRGMDAGRLTPRLRDALERERHAAELAAEREAAGGEHLELELRVAGLERRLQDVEEQLTSGLREMREELAGVRDEVKTSA